MKTLFCILIIISFIGCNEANKSAKKELTKEQKSIIESIVSFADSIGGEESFLQHYAFKNCSHKSQRRGVFKLLLL